MSRLSLIALAIASAIVAAHAQSGYVPPKGFVPDAMTAKSIARAVLKPIYGGRIVQGEEPLTARRQGEVWVVQGTLHCGAPDSRNCVGGVAEIHISAKDDKFST